MKKSFKNSSQVECIFTDDGVSFCGTKQEVFFPYGSIDNISLSFFGILQVNHGPKIGSFTVERQDKAEMKQMVKYAKTAMATAPKAEPQIIDLTQKNDKDIVSSELPPEEQLKQYKAQFIQGIISKEEYDARKRQLKNN